MYKRHKVTNKTQIPTRKSKQTLRENISHDNKVVLYCETYKLSQLYRKKQQAVSLISEERLGVDILTCLELLLSTERPVMRQRTGE